MPSITSLFSLQLELKSSEKIKTQEGSLSNLEFLRNAQMTRRNSSKWRMISPTSLKKRKKKHLAKPSTNLLSVLRSPKNPHNTWTKNGQISKKTNQTSLKKNQFLWPTAASPNRTKKVSRSSDSKMLVEKIKKCLLSKALFRKRLAEKRRPM